MSRRPVALFAVVALLIGTTTSCFRHARTQRQLGDAAYLSFPALQTPASCVLTGSERREFEIVPGTNLSYEIPAGTWTVEVRRGENRLMRRQLFLSAGDTREIDIR